MRIKFSAVPSILLITCLSNMSAQTVADFGAAVDEQRLITADNDRSSWLSYGRTYDEQRYSPLDQINKETIDQVGLAWFADMTTSPVSYTHLTLPTSDLV